MSTTSSSRAERLTLAVVLAAALLGCVTTAPDAPRPAAARRGARPSRVAASPLRPVELAAVRARKPDEKLARYAGRAFLEKARDPVAVEVRTAQPLPAEPRSSSPAIVLNGETLVDTWAILPDTLVAFLPDREKLREVNTVEVVWLGAEALTRSPRPVTFTRAEVR